MYGLEFLKIGKTVLGIKREPSDIGPGNNLETGLAEGAFQFVVKPVENRIEFCLILDEEGHGKRVNIGFGSEFVQPDGAEN